MEAMTDPAEFIDATLRHEADGYRGGAEKERLGSRLAFYGASVGAVRGTVRDALRRYPGLGHDEITALSSELWAAEVFERRLAAIVLLQSRVSLLRVSDLTRIEGFVRDARSRALVDPLAIDVVGPLVESLDAASRARADIALDRWSIEPDAWLGRAALLSPLRALRAGDGDWDAFVRRSRARRGAVPEETKQALEFVICELETSRPDLSL
jgi:3-methyladenine DNA glycosylase AlkD